MCVDILVCSPSRNVPSLVGLKLLLVSRFIVDACWWSDLTGYPDNECTVLIHVEQRSEVDELPQPSSDLA